MERETGVEPATSSLGNYSTFDSKGLSAFASPFSVLLKCMEFPSLSILPHVNVVPSYSRFETQFVDKNNLTLQ